MIAGSLTPGAAITIYVTEVCVLVGVCVMTNNYYNSATKYKIGLV